ncbi:MAG: hypothetical protein ACREIA_13085 [Opitutaceae bacterium]
MKTPRLSLPFFVFLGAVAAFLFQTPAPAQAPEGEGEEEEEIGQFFDRLLIPDGMSKEDIQAVLGEVLLGREWTVKQKTDRRVVGHILHGGAEATVTMRFGGEAVEIYAFGWDLDRRGNRVEPYYPERWLRYLRKDLQGRFEQYGVGR